MKMKKALKGLLTKTFRASLFVGTTGQISNLLIQDLKVLGEFVSLNGGLMRIGLTV
ncbi:hypothetical protein Niako_3864 [Niastella koreensis GR20-10]|uniref:Uncharacterized protein n=1 Tax=Niastella koreensis (strain DSM 17620 / KACC 11465 / NBRC 106392 / GR20-10) TaxID=700598 RepID=G8T8I0_NIAKG|nr:hypothetical protein Niako_3864 [Niastella koreensis GR20-10]